MIRFSVFLAVCVMCGLCDVASAKRFCFWHELPPIPNGYYPVITSQSCRRTTNGSCPAVCVQNYTGAPTLSCINGTWSTPTTTCQKVVCASKPPAGIVLNGVWPNSCANATLGFNCTANCTKTANQTNAPVSTCTAYGNWTIPKNPICKADCGDLGIPTDIAVDITTPCTPNRPPSTTAAVVFTISTPVVTDPAAFKNLSFQVDFPTALLQVANGVPTKAVTVACNATAGYPCPTPTYNLSQPIQSPLCPLVGNLEEIGSAECTVTYTVPATLPTPNTINGTILFAPLGCNRIDFPPNNQASSCIN